MKVLSVQHYPAFGGPHNEIIQLEPYLNELDIETVVAITEEPGDAADRMRGHVEVHEIPLGRFRRPPGIVENTVTLLRFRRDIAQLRSLIRTVDPDLVKVHGVHNPQGVVAAKLEKKSVVLVISSDLPHPVFRRLGMRFQRNRVDAVLSTGMRVLEAYPGYEPILGRSFFYVPPVNTDIYRPGGALEVEAARLELGVSSEDFVIGTVANINFQKGIDRLVDVASVVLPVIPNAKFLVIGGIADTQRDYYDGILKELRERGLHSDRFRFMGSRPDLWRLLPALNIKVLPSRAEGIPTSMLEAMAAGIPVVATDVGSVREVIVTGENGEVVLDGDTDSIADSILRLAADELLRKRYGEAARKTAVRRFSPEGCANVHQLAYQHAVGID